MDRSRFDEWEENYEVYTESQVELVLNECGVEIESETGTHFLCYCPFHTNTDSPALAVDKLKGLWHCFNGSCYQSGKLEDLPRKLLKLNIFQVKRLLLKGKTQSLKPLSERLLDSKQSTELPVFKQEIIDKMHNDFFGSPAEEYMKNRNFSDDTLKFFQVGYSAKKNLVAVPMYASVGSPVGVVGRTLPPMDKRFRNSDNLPKKQIPWNIQNARAHGDTLIICEASFDAMRIHQAGYPNVVALLGGYITPWHHKIIDKTFSRIIIMTDYDKLRYEVNCKKCKSNGERICIGHNTGRDFGREIAKQFPHKRIFWAVYDETCVYPLNPLKGYRDKPAKDASDMTDEEIVQCLRNSISNFEYKVRNTPEGLAS